VAAIPTERAAAVPIVRFRLASLLAAQLFDFATFALMVGRHGVAAELNPVVAQGFIGFGLPFLAFTKLAVVVLVGSIVVVLGRDAAERSPSRLAAGLAVLGVVAGVAGGISNAIAA
jgi:hypothetical protein